MIRPKASDQLDYEGEIVLVIGKTGRHIPRETGDRAISAAIPCATRARVRDWLRHGKFNVTQGKNFDRSGIDGPLDRHRRRGRSVEAAASSDAGQRRGPPGRHDGQLIFPFDFLISYISTFATLRPGDLIISGTPTGAGARFDPPKWLKPGDVIEIEVPGIGLLRNEVADEA